MLPRPIIVSGSLLFAVVLIASCGGLGMGSKADLEAAWNFKSVEALVFPLQDREREFSALVADSEALHLVSERAGKILRVKFPISPYSSFEESDLWAREGAQYEAAAQVGQDLFLLDESLGREENNSPLLVKVLFTNPGQRVTSYPLRFNGLDCQKGDCLEGLTVVGGRLYILDERDRLPEGGCAGRLYVTTLSALEEGAYDKAERSSLPLPNCQWRYTDLNHTDFGERTYLIALKVRCAWNQETLECEEDEYVIELINPQAGPKVVSSYRFPESAVNWWRVARVSRNLEGITVGPDGALYIVSDNLWNKGQEVKSLLLRVPKR
jgi:hypothetical protein